MSNIKSEAGLSIGADSVKNEQSEEIDHSILSDPEDYLEENESLDLNITNGNQKVWLVKLPRYLAEKWSKVDTHEGKQLGTVKIRQRPTGGIGNSSKKLEVKLVLKNDRQEYNDIPQEYDISMLNTQVNNSYVFSEENLSQFKQEVTELAEMPNQPELKEMENDFDLSSAANTKYYKVHKKENGNTSSSTTKEIPFVKTIPKKTSLVGKICHDCQIVPSKHDTKYGEMLKKRTRIEPTKNRPKVTLLEEIPGVIQSNAGPSIRGNNSSVFLRQNINKNKNEGRAIRMPQKDLLDLLFRLFEEYEYWSMKGLKERTKQPESYLKESVESIANMIKKGPYTSKYNLKPEYKKLRDKERQMRLGLNEEEKKSDGENEDDDIELEDVV